MYFNFFIYIKIIIKEKQHSVQNEKAIIKKIMYEKI